MRKIFDWALDLVGLFSIGLLSQCFLRVDECSSDSYIDYNDFFSRKSLEIWALFFRGFTFDFFLGSGNFLNLD